MPPKNNASPSPVAMLDELLMVTFPDVTAAVQALERWAAAETTMDTEPNATFFISVVTPEYGGSDKGVSVVMIAPARRKNRSWAEATRLFARGVNAVGVVNVWCGCARVYLDVEDHEYGYYTREASMRVGSRRVTVGAFETQPTVSNYTPIGPFGPPFSKALPADE